MNLENIVTSLELSQKLDEIGIKQDSLFVWANPFFPKVYGEVEDGETFWHDRICSAFTAQELWDILDGCHGIAIVNNKSSIGVPYSIIVDKCQTYHGKNISDCLAQLIIAQYGEKHE